MKIKTFKQFESTDEIDSEYNGIKYDAYIFDDDAYPFIYTQDNELLIGDDGTDHGENENFEDYFSCEMVETSGRYWSERKILSFWSDPKDFNKFCDIFKSITGYDLYDGWLIEVYDNKTNEYNLVETKDFVHTGYNSVAYSEHLKKQQEKEQEKKNRINTGLCPLKGYGGGSKYRSKDVDKNNMTKAQYHSYIHKENMILTLEEYKKNNPDMLGDTPNINYVEVDYYSFTPEMDETEPPNATGRDDREVKNKTKKAINKISPS